MAPKTVKKVVEAEPVEKKVEKVAKKAEKKVEKKATKKPVAKKAVKKTVKGGDEVEKIERHYRMIVDMASAETRGYYEGNNPKQAATKAFSSYLKSLKKKGGKIPKSLDFAIKETTRSGNNKRGNVTFYTGKRETLKEPVQVEVKGEDGEVKTISYKFRNVVFRNRDLDVKYAELAGGAKKKRAEAKKKLLKKEKKEKDAAEGKVAKRASKKEGVKKTTTKKAVAKKPAKKEKEVVVAKKPAKKASTKKEAVPVKGKTKASPKDKVKAK